MNDFKNEGVVASSAWGYQVNALKAEKQPIDSTIPTEGSTGWADTTMLHASAQNPVCAYKWMEWSLNKNLQSAAGRVVRLQPGGARRLQDGGARRRGLLQDATASSASRRSTSGRRPWPSAPARAHCVPYSKWTQDYIAIMGGR